MTRLGPAVCSIGIAIDVAVVFPVAATATAAVAASRVVVVGDGQWAAGP